MNRALILLFLAGMLTVALAPAAQQAIAAQSSNPQTADSPQPQASHQASSHDRHHTKRSSSVGKRHHRNHKTSAKR